ncbi:MAG TPA: aminotransferase class I/II-fold pyridoxal phosphate-dependent enzyme [Actinomycetota bacterium]|nr:aminotransferase class I/II-fold pyridoxal phosphate-dependent enzyme [Actinomycetota bacterium]
MTHRFSKSMQRMQEADEPLWRFFTESGYANRDPADPGVCDFVAGNPQEMVLPEYVESLQRWTVPQDKDWYAYKFNEPYAQEAAAAGLRERRGVPFEADDVIVTDGAFAGLNLCIRTVTDPGDEVMFLTPPWFFYEAIVIGGEARPVRVAVDYRSWDLDLDAIEAAITERTSAIIVNSPNNPSGKIYPPETLRALAEILGAASERVQRPIYLISDEAYSRIVFDDRPYPSPTEFYPYSFLVYTYAKQLLTPGQRVGYVALPPTMPDREPMREALMLAQLTYGGHAAPNNVMQRAMADLEQMSVDVKALQRRRDRMVEALGSFGYDLHSPEGTFYLLPTSPDPDDVAFGERLAKEKVFILPGTVVEMPGRFRISITGNDDMVERSLPIFEQAAAGS